MTIYLITKHYVTENCPCTIIWLTVIGGVDGDMSPRVYDPRCGVDPVRPARGRNKRRAGDSLSRTRVHKPHRRQTTRRNVQT